MTPRGSDIQPLALHPADTVQTAQPSSALRCGDHSRMRVRYLGLAHYVDTWQRMRRFAQERDAQTPDELWLCEHPPVYTQGVAGKEEHILDAGDIPVVKSDRGGQVTYHGPGQVVAYPLLDLRRLRIHVKEYVFRIEAAVLQTLEGLGVTGHRVAGAPGVYVRLAAPHAHASLDRTTAHTWEGLGKVAALGIKITNHCTYHGVALNVAMDLSPFARINPCGYRGLAAIDLATLGISAAEADVAHRLAQRLMAHLVPTPSS